MRVICEHCNGEGFIPAGITAITCHKCKGVGWFLLDIDVLYNMHITEICPLDEDVYNSKWAITTNQIETLYEQNT